MDLEMVLNELSLYPLATDVHDARQRMDVLMRTIVLATRSGVKKILRTPSNFVAENLAPSYPVAKWLNDANVDRDLQRFFRTIITKSPFLVDITDSSTLESFGLSDYFFEEKRATGLGVTFLLDALALSLSSDPCWGESYLELKIGQLDDDGEIIELLETIHHASVISHIKEHLSWINERLHANIQSDVHEGLDIWLHRDEWFPHLYFGGELEDQLKALKHGHLMLMPILKRLHELEDYCCNWLDGSFDHDKIISKATPESAVTLEMYGADHTFRDHEGVSRIFSWHVRLTPGAWRLHFDPLPDERKLIVGYIGVKLSTKLYSH